MGPRSGPKPPRFLPKGQMEVTDGGAWETAQEITKIAAVPSCGWVECVYSFVLHVVALW